jgi:hypothetical protein
VRWACSVFEGPAYARNLLSAEPWDSFNVNHQYHFPGATLYVAWVMQNCDVGALIRKTDCWSK